MRRCPLYDRGIVSEVDVATHRVRVRMPQREDVVTGWLDVLVPATHEENVHGLPRVGSQVALLLDEQANAGCVLGAIYSSADPAPNLPLSVRAITFTDGTRIEFDAASSTLRTTSPHHELGGTSDVALAHLVLSELQAIRAELASHTHPASTVIAPAGTAGGPCAGATGAAGSGYSPSSVASTTLKAG